MARCDRKWDLLICTSKASLCVSSLLPNVCRVNGGAFYQANVIVARQVALRYAHVGIVSISLNPGAHYFFLSERSAPMTHIPICNKGNIYSELYREVPKLQQKIFVRLRRWFTSIINTYF